MDTAGNCYWRGALAEEPAIAGLVVPMVLHRNVLRLDEGRLMGVAHHESRRTLAEPESV